MTQPLVGSERELLRAFLDQQREVLLWKLEGLNDRQLRQPIAPSGLNLLGLAKHVAGVEQYWLCQLFGRPAELPFKDRAAADDLQLDPDDTTESVLAYLSRTGVASGAAIAEVDLDATAMTWLGDTVSFRWAILHTIEEATRHVGHVDIIREGIDGMTGHLPNESPY